jgi:PKD repeat protein
VSHTYEWPGSSYFTLTVRGDGGENTENKRGPIVVTGTHFVFLPVVMR